MQQPYSIEKIKYLRRYTGLRYRDIGNMVGYSANTMGSMVYQISSGRYDPVKARRIRLLLTYILNDYIREKYGEDAYKQILRATDERLETKTGENRQRRADDEDKAM